MAIILYSTGMQEECLPQEKYFTVEELSDLLDDEEAVMSFRLNTSANPNMWIISGAVIRGEEYYNAIASVILNKDIYSDVIFFHDSELDPELQLVDTPINTTYSQFVSNIRKLINSTALRFNDDINNAGQPDDEQDSIISNKVKEPLKIIYTVLTTEPGGRYILEFDHKLNPDKFWLDESFGTLCELAYLHLSQNEMPIDGDHILILKSEVADIVVKAGDNFNWLFTKMIDYFANLERYEECNTLDLLKTSVKSLNI